MRFEKFKKNWEKKNPGSFFLSFQPSKKLKSQYKNNETLFEKCALLFSSGYVSTLIFYLADPVIFGLFFSYWQSEQKTPGHAFA